MVHFKLYHKIMQFIHIFTSTSNFLYIPFDSSIQGM